jgi:K+-transporting ATPase ATPase A chain
VTTAAAGQIVLYFVVLTLLALPLGAYIARVFKGESRIADRILGPLERLLYRLAGVDPKRR